MNFINDFKKHLASHGLFLDKDPIADGRLHRFKNKCDAHPNSWYVLYNDNLPAGAFGCWKLGIDEKWCSKSLNQLSREEQKHYKQKIQCAKDAQEKERTKCHAEARIRAQELWNNAKPASPNHPYLVKKKVNPYGIKQYGDELIIPIRNRATEIQSLQFIKSNGSKLFLPGGSVTGNYHSIGKPTNTILINEGFATGASSHLATGESAVVAFCAANLLPVAVIMKDKYPNHKIVIVADNDQWNNNKINIGVNKAREAAESIGARLVAPCFDGLDVTQKPTDMNDLMLLAGIDEVRRQLNSITDAKETTEDAILRLSKLPPIQYDQERKKEAQLHNIRVSTLDESVDKKRPRDSKTNTECELETGVTPWPEPVNGADLAQELKDLFYDHVILSEWQIITLILWVFGTYCFDAFPIFPKLLLTSPTKRCGKTTLLKILNYSTNRALVVSNISAAAIFRAVDAWKPTLLIDEADTFIKNNAELHGIINSGHTKDTAFVLRVEGDSGNRAPKLFSTWAPMAIAMIGHPQETIVDRSIIICLRRKSENERTRKLDIDCSKQLTTLRQKLKKWADDNFEALKEIRPQVPSTGSDRTTDNWLPLFAIATLLGAEFVNSATAAIKAITTVDNEESIATMLLCDIRDIFEISETKKIYSDDLVAKLNDLEDRPWVECRNGTPMTKNTLARMLKPFGIKSKQMFINYKNKNGYELSDFTDAFIRYISPTQNSRTLDSNTNEVLGSIQNSRHNSSLEFQNILQPNIDGSSRVLEFQKESMEENNKREVITL